MLKILFNDPLAAKNTLKLTPFLQIKSYRTIAFASMLLLVTRFTQAESPVFKEYSEADFCHDIAYNLNHHKSAQLINSFDINAYIQRLGIKQNNTDTSDVQAKTATLATPLADNQQTKNSPELTDKQRADTYKGINDGLAIGLTKSFYNSFNRIAGMENWTYQYRPNDAAPCTIATKGDDNSGYYLIQFYFGHNVQGMPTIVDLIDHTVSSIPNSALAVNIFKSLGFLNSDNRILDIEKVDKLPKLAIMKTVEAGKIDSALRTLDENFPETKNDPYFYIGMLNRLETNTKAVEKIKTRLEALVKNNPDFDFFMFDTYIEQNDIRSIKRILTKLNQQFSDLDIVQNMNLGIAFLDAKDNSIEAITNRNKALAEALTKGYEDKELFELILSQSAENKQYQQSVDALIVLENRFGDVFEPKKMKSNSQLKDFAKSEEFNQWVKSDVKAKN